jgi:hypothetical protein
MSVPVALIRLVLRLRARIEYCCSLQLTIGRIQGTGVMLLEDVVVCTLILNMHQRPCGVTSLQAVL